MPSSGGQSVLGFQSMPVEIKPVDGFFKLELTDEPAARERAIGYYFIGSFFETGNFQSSVIAQGRVYIPGVRVILNPLYWVDQEKAYMHVYWNREGLNFFYELR